MPRANKPRDPSREQLARTLSFTLIVITIALGLLFVWNKLPRRTPAPAGSPPAAAPIPKPAPWPDRAGDLTRVACEAAGGYWTDCGSPCRGKGKDVACIQVCEPQCLCGGRGWQCPADYVCTDYEPDERTPEAIGACRKEQRSDVRGQMSEVRERPAGTVCDPQNFICVSETYQNTLLESPFTVTGTAIAFEQTFSWRLEDARGTKLAEGYSMTNAPDLGIPGPFTIRAFILTVPTTATGTLVLFESSPKDGSETHVLRIPVRLPTQSMSVKVFLPSSEDLTRNDCSIVTPRTLEVARTRLPVETSLRALLAASNLFAGAELVSLKVANGTATIELRLAPGIGGACLVTSQRAALEATTKQFSSVQRVVIFETGKSPEESLQP
jgi:hypothetical protein